MLFLRVGFDIGSTTVKCIALDSTGNVVYKKYERHYSEVNKKIENIINDIHKNFLEVETLKLSVSGSVGIGISESLGIPFIQEVYSVKKAADEYIPNTDVIIELGGEDAKILFVSGTLEVRMNGSCAGGTGAFIDQMASLLGVDIQKLNDMAKNSDKIYKIASRCGVFAKSDIQPLLNQGANKNNIVASIFDAVKNQTISGLAQGRKIKGNVVYLGGPLTFMPELRYSFDKELGIEGICPNNSLYYVALGAALCANKDFSVQDVLDKFSFEKKDCKIVSCPPLFKNEKEYDSFKKRHVNNSVKVLSLKNFDGEAFIGIDAGSTTFKGVVVDKDLNIIYSQYLKNNLGPIELTKTFLKSLYEKHPEIKIVSSAVTGYGEELIKKAFNIDFGIVETVAHFISAKSFISDVDFVIDIGGQDIKCFKVKNGVIDDIFLNEACSSGCGSFLQTFAESMKYSVSDFSKIGLFSKNPVELGSRCTVFMNSAIKQAQKDGAGIDDIAAGLCMSVVKNAIYKVIRARSSDHIGKNIVVQGGTFLSDLVLRAFEIELGHEVVRPNISELMGAYGCAIYAKEKHCTDKSSILSKQEIQEFSYKSFNASCGMCGNKCSLIVNSFNDDRKFISGNMCQRPITKKTVNNELNLYNYKRELLSEYKNTDQYNNLTIGIPMVLNMYELLPFWFRFFKELGFNVKTSPINEKGIYLLGNDTIPSDTVCFPAKLVHGHIKYLLNQGIRTIFYPCMSYNFDEGISDNNYNCPIVAYYPETIRANLEFPEDVCFINDYIGIHKPRLFPFKMYNILKKYIHSISLIDIKHATKLAYMENDLYMNKIRKKSKEIVSCARKNNMKIIVLAGRPYHIDKEINHSIDNLILELGAAVISEDSVTLKESIKDINVLNQWTYHARLYSAAKYISRTKDIYLVQLTSFGCGIDAITSDEIREILESNGKIYTQIKIDEVSNLGAAKIRIRSLFSAIQ